MAEYSWLIDDIETLSTYTKDGYTRAVLNQAVKAIRKLSADVQPVRHGRWKKKWHLIYHQEMPCCLECHHFSPLEWDFCPNCGARMDKQESSAEYDPDKFFGRKK